MVHSALPGPRAYQPILDRLFVGACVFGFALIVGEAAQIIYLYLS